MLTPVQPVLHHSSGKASTTVPLAGTGMTRPGSEHRVSCSRGRRLNSFWIIYVITNSTCSLCTSCYCCFCCLLLYVAVIFLFFDSRQSFIVAPYFSLAEVRIVVTGRKYIEGIQPEWCLSSMIYSRDTPFWSENPRYIFFFQGCQS